MENNQAKRLFIVIHTVTANLLGLEHTIDQTAVAQANGADGVVLIPDYAKGWARRATYQDQILYLRALKERYLNFSIGANFLQSFSSDQVEEVYSLNLNLIQTDSSKLDDLDKARLGKTETFCGLAFKYSRLVNITGPELKTHCEHVASICDIPTTSGNKTGAAADINKIAEIRSCLPVGKRLGIASGVDEDNVSAYLKAGVTDFLVATSLINHADELGRDILDPNKVARLAAIIHN